MKYLKFFVICSSIVFSFDLSANPGAWMPEGKKISEIFIEGSDTGKALIVIEGGVPSAYIPPECNSGSDARYNTVYLNTEKGRSIYSLALAAYMGGKPVKLALSCTDNRPLITHIRF